MLYVAAMYFLEDRRILVLNKGFCTMTLNGKERERAWVRIGSARFE